MIINEYNSLKILVLLISLVIGEQSSAAKSCAAVFQNETRQWRSSTGKQAAVRDIEIRSAIKTLGASTRRLSVVVPVYRELDNGNILRLLESATEQTAALDKIELVFVVNNTPEIARTPSSPIYNENQRTIQLLRYLSGETHSIPRFVSNLPSPERAMIAKLKNKNINITTIDLSTKGIERNIGIIRDEGVQTILRRNQSVAQEGIISMMDADTVLPPKYAEEIIFNFTKYKYDSFFLGMKFEVDPNGSADLIRTHARDLYWPAWESFNSAFKGEARQGFGSPQIVASAKMLKQIGGVPHLPKREDVALAEILISKGNSGTATDLKVTTQDRARVDGYSSARRLRELEEGVEPGWTTPHADPLIASLAMALDQHAANKDSSFEKIQSLFDFYGFEFNQVKWQTSLNKARSKDITSLGEVFRKFYLFNAGTSIHDVRPGEHVLEFLKQNLPANELQLLAKDIAEQQKSHNRSAALLTGIVRRKLNTGSVSLTPAEAIDPYVKLFAAQDFGFKSEVIKRAAQIGDEKSVMDLLKKDYPDWFLPFSKTPLRQRLVYLDSLGTHFNRVRTEPGLYPMSTKLWKAFDGKPEDFIALINKKTREQKTIVDWFDPKSSEQTWKNFEFRFQETVQKNLSSTSQYYQSAISSGNPYVKFLQQIGADFSGKGKMPSLAKILAAFEGLVQESIKSDGVDSKSIIRGAVVFENNAGEQTYLFPGQNIPVGFFPATSLLTGPQFRKMILAGFFPIGGFEAELTDLRPLATIQHDLAHLFAIAKYPKFAATLKRVYNELPNEGADLNAKWTELNEPWFSPVSDRLFFAVEAMTTLPPKNRSWLLDLGLMPPQFGTNRYEQATVSEVFDYLNNRNPQTLTEKIDALLAQAEQKVVSHGGGNLDVLSPMRVNISNKHKSYDSTILEMIQVLRTPSKHGLVFGSEKYLRETSRLVTLLWESSWLAPEQWLLDGGKRTLSKSSHLYKMFCTSGVFTSENYYFGAHCK
ncbi:MAG: hypothetical protein V4736_05120 [Bdellovibrionota bacterium]